jgi:hypothetical protein
MIEDIQFEGFNIKSKKSLSLQKLASQHTKYYGIVGLVTSEQNSPEKPRAPVNSSPYKLSPVKTPEPKRDICLEDRV